MRKVKKTRDMDYESMVAGYAPNPKRKKYRDADERILNLTNQFIGRSAQPPQTMWQFLKGIAHNFSMN